MKSRFFLFIFLLIMISPAFGQTIFFNRVLPPEGKTFLHVTGITQDKQGYIWLATKKGLFRYDGYEMLSYKSDPLNKNSLVNDALESICVDSAGMIWIGTFGFGLERFDPVSGVFTHFRNNPQEPASLGHDYINIVFTDKEGTLWVGTGNGLDRFDAKAGKFIHYTHRQGDPASISNNQVRAIYEDRQGTLWIGTGSVYGADGGRPDEGGLNRMDKKTGKFIRYLHDPGNPRSLINNKVRAIFEDSKGNFWIGTAGDGLHTMDRKNGTFQRHPYDPAHPGKLSRPPIHRTFGATDHITFITEDASGAIWIGTAESGINYYDPKTQAVKHFQSESEAAGAYTDITAWWAYTSRDGVLWISSITGNLYRVNTSSLKVPFYATQDSMIKAFYEEKNGTLWLGSEDRGGLIVKDQSGRIMKRFVHDPADKATLDHNGVNAILKDQQGRLWVGTSVGLNLFDQEKQNFTHYNPNTKNSNIAGRDYISCLYEDRQSNLWIGTVWGLKRMNDATPSFRHYHFFPEDTTSFFGLDAVTSVLEDRKAQIWVSSGIQAGIYRLNKENGSFKVYIKGTTILKILEDRHGVIWAGGDGLFQYKADTDSFYHFIDPVSQAEIGSIHSLIEDDEGNLWMRTVDGIIKLNRQRNAITNFSRRFGVDRNELVYGAAYKGPAGKLYFGHVAGYYAFFPGQLTKGLKPPEVLISAFHLSNQLVLPGKNGPLTSSVYETEEIRLQHNQNVFSFNFAAIDYTYPEENRLFFMLENYDKVWHRAGTDRRAMYFNVPPGQYVFRVKAVNNSGLWAEKQIAISLLPPWWRTWWAYSLFILSFVAIIWAIIHFRSLSLVKEKKRLEKLVQLRTSEVVKQKEEISVQRDNLEQTLEELKSTQAQLIQREKMASLGELTAGIAHEIQNPLNFVNNFSEVNKEHIEEMKLHLQAGQIDEAVSLADEIRENNTKIHDHGQRADSIVKSMLQHSRATAGKKQPTDINAMAEEYLRLCYHGLRAKDKSFEAKLQTGFDESINNVNVVPQAISRVLLNLFNNAFYSVHEKKKQQLGSYTPVITVSTKNQDDKIIISVYDNGLGVPEKVVDKIFQPFFTTKPAGQGTGLGLSLSYDIITKEHGGELKVNTKEGEYAEFIIQLPAHE